MSIKINKNCRVCGSPDLKSVINLGQQSLTGVFINDGSTVDKYNMSLSMCKSCGLTQINEVYDLDLLYGDGYGYESALNSSMVDHLELKAAKIKEKVSINKDDVVIDIGSNDATTLSFFEEDIIKIGVDFTGKKFLENYKKINATLVPDFFPSPTLNNELDGRKAKIISSYSCFYDLPDPVSFAKEICKCLHKNGLWCLEQSYMPMMLETNSFDTICHEHIEYYKLTDIKNICFQAGLEIKDVEFNDINGGSFSILVGHINGPFFQSDSTKKILNNESLKNWSDEFEKFNKRINILKEETVTLLESLKNQGKRVVGIGASTKGNVLLQYYNLTPSHIECIGEVNKNKYNCSTPGTNIPIVNEKDLLDSKPDYLFILPWHFKDFFLSNNAFDEFSIILPLPELTVIERGS
jgi:hypothetical protein